MRDVLLYAKHLFAASIVAGWPSTPTKALGATLPRMPWPPSREAAYRHIDREAQIVARSVCGSRPFLNFDRSERAG